ncbi:MAG: LysM peptidoglycan-binding domain-containing M23 family metallopeptidase [Myxococcota bacterium]
MSDSCFNASRRRWVSAVFGAAACSAAVVSCAATLPESATSTMSSAPAKTHTVAAGETLWRIAQNHGVSVDELMSANRIEDPTALAIGRTLAIPGGGTQPAPSGDALARVRARALARGERGSESSKSSGTGLKAESARPAKAPAKAKPARKRKVPSVGRVSVAKYPLRWPVRGKVLRRYGRSGKKHHDGIDILADAGEPVHAAAAGKVVFADEHGGYGKLILLRHDSGLITVYAHQSALLVKKGDRVDGGRVIAKVGATGSASSAHLHFEVRRGIDPQNPLRFLPP